MNSNSFHQRPTSEEMFLLHRMDSLRGECIVVATDQRRLRSASFLDGRETFWRSEEFLPLQLRPAGSRRVERFVFHVGFCGSTLLARLLDRPGKVLSLKEPQCLADIAGQREAIAAGRAVAPMNGLIDHALGQLFEAGGGDMTVVVKPTNWVNLLLPELCAPERDVRAIFVSMGRRAFLTAVFRGGQPRLAFCTRLAAQIAAELPRGNVALNAAIESGGEALDRAARITALLHAMQEVLFNRAIEANGWSEKVRIDFDHLIRNPKSVLSRARSLLELNTEEDDSKRDLLLMERHSKSPESAFRPSSRLQENSVIEQYHGERFETALDWVKTIASEFI